MLMLTIAILSVVELFIFKLICRILRDTNQSSPAYPKINKNAMRRNPTRVECSMQSRTIVIAWTNCIIKIVARTTFYYFILLILFSFKSKQQISDSKVCVYSPMQIQFVYNMYIVHIHETRGNANNFHRISWKFEIC